MRHLIESKVGSFYSGRIISGFYRVILLRFPQAKAFIIFFLFYTMRQLSKCGLISDAMEQTPIHCTGVYTRQIGPSPVLLSPCIRLFEHFTRYLRIGQKAVKHMIFYAPLMAVIQHFASLNKLNAIIKIHIHKRRHIGR